MFLYFGLRLASSFSSCSPLCGMASFEVGDRVFLRINLHPAEDKDPELRRGDSGEVIDVRAADDTVKVKFSPRLFVRCKPEWLERSPGTICLGIKAMLAEGIHLNQYGMMVTDVRVPKEQDECFRRMQRNMMRLQQSDLGFSFYDGVDASCARYYFGNGLGWSREELDEEIGVILCEGIWLSNRQRWPDVADFHASIAAALMSQWGNATCVLVLRSKDAQQLRRKMPNARRISFHYESDNQFNLHYTPLCMDSADPPNPVAGEHWCDIVIHPIRVDRRLVDSTGSVFIPELVLKAMFSRRCTLQLCAYTMESAINIMEYINAVKKLHGVR